MNASLSPEAEAALAHMVAIWSHGEAARRDPVLVNMLARHAAHLNRIAPGAIEKVRAALENPQARGAG